MKKNLLYFIQAVEKLLIEEKKQFTPVDLITKGSWLMAHLVCESGWGVSTLTAETGNYFGIKWVKASTYPKSERAYWDNAIKDYSYYEVHGDLEGSVKAFFAFLKRNSKRYKNLVRAFENDSTTNLWTGNLNMSGLTNEMARVGYFESWCRPFNHWDIVRTVLRRDRKEGYEGLKYVVSKFDKADALSKLTVEELHLKLDDHSITQAMMNLDLVCKQLISDKDFHDPAVDMTTEFAKLNVWFNKNDSSKLFVKIKCQLIDIRAQPFHKWQLMMRDSTEIDCINHFYHGIYYAKWIPQSIRNCFPFHSYEPGSGLRDTSLADGCSCDDEEVFLRPKLVNVSGKVEVKEKKKTEEIKTKEVKTKEVKKVILEPKEQEEQKKKKDESITPINEEIKITDQILAEDIDYPVTQEEISVPVVPKDLTSYIKVETAYIPMSDVFANRNAGEKSRYIN